MPGLLARWFTPAPDSAAATTLRRGKPLWTDTIHLMWSVWVVITPMFSPPGYTARWFALTLLSYPLFLLLWFRAYVEPQHRMYRYGVGLIALTLVLLPWYPSGMSYFVFGCVLLRPTAGARPFGVYVLRLAVAVAVFMAWAVAIGYPWQAIVWMPLVAMIVGTIVHVECLNEQKDIALKLSQDEVRRLAATAERERIGRDLHDLLGHTLSLVALKADLAGRLLQRDPQAAQREIGELGQVAREALGQVRRAVTGIRAAGLAAELAAARVLLEVEGVALQVELDEAALPPEQETALALCLREAVTNIHRHARARHVQVSLRRVAQRWQLRIEDDGRGGAIRPGNGLEGMRERLQALGGSLRVEPAPRRGTLLLAELPHWDGTEASPVIPEDAHTKSL
ncbi:sensor histidine kinase [Pseudoxanthomonas suwonensis]|uniref:Histidine kinase n=1 Tax=Pseudoxanthomonas suwonensis TaxID=314722 RepID=A0A0E3UND0_9GAMM|nr:sensor histidine kinase [Pseudoxanthomonas suwonensis]AKC87061.1 histidine kinase [Pseudoxanthomonas suwonensis]